MLHDVRVCTSIYLSAAVQCVATLLLLQLLLVVIVCRMDQFVPVIHCTIFQCLLNSNTFFFLHLICNVPLASTAAFSESILFPVVHIIHPGYYGHVRSQSGR